MVRGSRPLIKKIIMPKANTVLVVQIVLNIIVVNINRLCFSGFAVFQCPFVRIESSYSSFPRNFNIFSMVRSVHWGCTFVCLIVAILDLAISVIPNVIFWWRTWKPYDGNQHHASAGVLGWLLVVVLFAPIRGGSLEICSVSCMLYGMVRKH